jgi:transposase
MISQARLSDEVKLYITHIETENNQLKNTVHNNIIQFEKYENQFEKYETKVARLEKLNLLLEEQLRLAMYKRFGKLAERFIDTHQLLLFASQETQAPHEPPPAHEETYTVAEHTRVKRGRKPLDENLPRTDIIVDIPEEEKTCACGHPLVCIGEEVSERLQIIPQQIYVEVLHKPKYACHHCEGSADEENPAVRMAKTPGNIMPGSIATPGLLSFIFTQKYCDCLP